jgi:oxygen-independent coproporphyrinogen-3 oxidase
MLSSTRMNVRRISSLWPVFRLDWAGRTALYAPGHIVAVPSAAASEIENAWAAGRDIEAAAPSRVAEALRLAASAAIGQAQASFEPECLAITVSNRCNLSCPYCYAAGPSNGTAEVDARAIAAAARLVAANCARSGKPFHLAVQGDGEPSLERDRLDMAVAITRDVATAAGLAWFGYVSTNGAVADDASQWLVRTFSRVSLSCDGPPDIQDRQRPRAGGAPSSASVARTACAILSAHGRLDVRATITPGTMTRQSEIVRYLRHALGATHIRFEPVYRSASPSRCDDAAAFADCFLEAQRTARSLGADLSLSGVRLDEIHGPHCDVLRQTLRLNNSGFVTACFCRTPAERFRIGAFDPESGEFVLDQQRIRALTAAARAPDACRDCVNVLHCARGCPDECPCVGEERIGGFRCLLYQRLSAAWLRDMIESFEPSSMPVSGYLKDAPEEVDGDSILRQWEAVRSHRRVEDRRMPDPLWKERGFDDDGAAAWHTLSTRAATDPAKPLSIYIHVPFCDRRCGFCDCHAIACGKPGPRQDAYARLLCREMRSWARTAAAAGRPVTTVHFGGGTPASLGCAMLGEVVGCVRECFGVTQATEWALESTSNLLSPEHLDWLAEAGFSRLHVGVQTLEEPLRTRIGRRERAAAVCARLAQAIGRGFVTSVDVIYGLPGQTIAGLLGTLRTLVEAGVHGMSLYRLTISDRNRRFLEQFHDFAPEPLRDYCYFHAAHQFLAAAGFRKNHFDHFARTVDRNLYATHAFRGEDLLGIGASADGIFGDYVYRHPLYAAYIAGEEAPVLEGGMRQTGIERRLYSFQAALTAGHVPGEALRAIGGGTLLEEWRSAALIEDDGGGFALTTNGSWLVRDMIDDVRGLISTLQDVAQ